MIELNSLSYINAIIVGLYLGKSWYKTKLEKIILITNLLAVIVAVVI